MGKRQEGGGGWDLGDMNYAEMYSISSYLPLGVSFFGY